MRQMGSIKLQPFTGLLILVIIIHCCNISETFDLSFEFHGQNINSSAGIIVPSGKSPNVTMGTSFSLRHFAKQRIHQTRPIWRQGAGHTGNVIDDCWRGDAQWAHNRMQLADCAKGFGSNALGGKYGRYYVVTRTDDDPVNPAPGTLRYGATLPGPTWIYFAHDMLIVLKYELIVSSFKTFDGRGANVQIAYGACFTVQYVSHVIIHGLHIHDCIPGSSGDVKSSAWHTGYRQGSKGSAIVIFGSNNVWIDHNSLSHCYDGLVDVIHASTDVTISNNYFTNHDEVMLLGHDDSYSADKIMKVTVMYNHFGPGLVERMPRVRFGFAHVVNNRYTAWLMYAVGGSANPTIKSEGNYFLAPNNPSFKQVTKRQSGNWMKWEWKSVGDLFLNGAYFVQSGYGAADPYYTSRQWFQAKPAALVLELTYNSGALSCNTQYSC
ncbi:hypothetical protein O6H91_04G075000 [Diphasiastrum complanatum]|uniref:Uncharacterized protein n=1 Tax=Diphasiastrum complanatum TaxID=34168 RepID=A0ACC2DY94_DIPCM|nr:hypothetical protein O6H91_04G075000 [Diphasiastrum complanatum]